MFIWSNPQGARLIGRYDSQIAFGQSRVLLVWTRLIMPNGKSIVLERQPGVDTSGYSGLEDEVDITGRRSSRQRCSRPCSASGPKPAPAATRTISSRRSGAGGCESFSQVAQRVVSRNLDIQPTLTIRPGFPVRVIVNRDLVLPPYNQEAVR
jgi:type IV secretion system protein TrbI